MSEVNNIFHIDETIDLFDMSAVENMIKTYGKIFTANYKDTKICVVTDTEIVQHILKHQNHNYSNGKGMMSQFTAMFGEGILTSDGERWKRARKMILPLNTQKIFDEYEKHFIGFFPNIIDKLDKLTGQDIEIRPIVSNISLSLGVLCYLGIDDIKDLPKQELDELNYLIAKLRFPLKEDKAEFLRKVKQCFDSYHEKIELHIERRRNRQYEQLYKDLFSILFENSADDSEYIHTQVATFVAAAYDTTSTSMYFLLKIISTRPDLQKIVENEISQFENFPLTFEQIDSLKQTKAIVQEVLRLYPPLWVIPRFSLTDSKCKGFHLPKGMDYIIHTFFIQRDSKYWKNPNEFNHTRFVGSQKSSNNFAYLPFSFGPRICFGMRFAMTEIIATLACIVRKFDIKPTKEDITLNPIYPIMSTTVPLKMRLERKL